MKTIATKRPAKDERERLVLLGLVELYLETGKPIGSNTLQQNGFDALSSATIRNYFAKLEEAGYLKQQHSSGGRIPTSLAYKLYADAHRTSSTLEDKEKKVLSSNLSKISREIAAYLQQAGEIISDSTRCAVFLSSPRFDQDFVLDVKLLGIDQSRCLCILITDFGLIHTETLYYSEKKLSSFSLKRIESYFRWRITGLDKPESLSPEEERQAVLFYNEIMLRHIVTYGNFSAEDIYKTGFSKLLSYSDFNDASMLAGGLSLFENPTCLRTLLKSATEQNQLSVWIGDDLQQISKSHSACSVIAIPYRINQTIVGAIGILGPHRIPYRKLFGILQSASDAISETLTKSVYKFKISFRQPETSRIGAKNFDAHATCLLLEDKT